MTVGRSGLLLALAVLTAFGLAQADGAPVRTRAGAARICPTADMRLTIGPPVTAKTGEHADLFVLTNRTRRSCMLEGYPRIRLKRRGHALGFVYQNGGGPYVTRRRPRPVALAPGKRAYFLVAKYRCDGGDLRAATSIRVLVPGAARWLRASLTGDGVMGLASCRRYPGDAPVDPGDHVAVSPIEPTLVLALAQP